MSLLLTGFQALVYHHVDHVLHVREALLLKVINDLRDQFLLSPDEQYTFLHDRGWDLDLLEVIDSDPFERTSVVGETLPIQFLFFLRILDKAFALGRNRLV